MFRVEVYADIRTMGLEFWREIRIEDKIQEFTQR